MQVAFIVLNNTDRLDELLKEFVNIGIKGATILDSMGMGGFLASEGEDMPFFSSLRMLLNQGKPINKTIFSVVTDDQVPLLVKSFELIVGKLHQPNTGIIFTIPVSFVKGGELK